MVHCCAAYFAATGRDNSLQLDPEGQIPAHNTAKPTLPDGDITNVSHDPLTLTCSAVMDRLVYPLLFLIVLTVIVYGNT